MWHFVISSSILGSSHLFSISAVFATVAALRGARQLKFREEVANSFAWDNADGGHNVPQRHIRPIDSVICAIEPEFLTARTPREMVAV